MIRRNENPARKVADNFYLDTNSLDKVQAQ